jgi:hypothetical protein
MRALVYENHLPRLAATKLRSAFPRRAFVGPLAPIQLRQNRDAFTACFEHGASGALKVLFDRF